MHGIIMSVFDLRSRFLSAGGLPCCAGCEYMMPTSVKIHGTDSSLILLAFRNWPCLFRPWNLTIRAAM